MRGVRGRRGLPGGEIKKQNLMKLQQDKKKAYGNHRRVGSQKKKKKKITNTHSMNVNNVVVGSMVMREINSSSLPGQK